MGTIASQFTSVSIVYSTVCSGSDKRKHQSSASLVFVRGIYRRPVNSPHKGLVRWKCFHLMTSSWLLKVRTFYSGRGGRFPRAFRAGVIIVYSPKALCHHWSHRHRDKITVGHIVSMRREARTVIPVKQHRCQHRCPDDWFINWCLENCFIHGTRPSVIIRHDSDMFCCNRYCITVAFTMPPDPWNLPRTPYSVDFKALCIIMVVCTKYSLYGVKRSNIKSLSINHAKYPQMLANIIQHKIKKI